MRRRAEIARAIDDAHAAFSRDGLDLEAVCDRRHLLRAVSRLLSAEQWKEHVADALGQRHLEVLLGGAAQTWIVARGWCGARP